MANNLGDFDTSAVIYGKFTTFRPSTGATYTLGGTPALSVYKDNSTTQSTSGVTLTADFDSVTGLNHFAIDTSTDGTFYSAGSFFDVVITTGTVDSVSVTGSCIGQFTLRKTSSLKPTTAGRTLDVSSGGEAGIDWANIGSPTTTVNLSGTTVSVSTSVTNRVTANVDQIDGASWSTHATGMAPADLRDIAGAAVSTSTAQLGVNIVNVKGSASAGAPGYVGIDWSAINAPTTSVNLSGTTISTSQVVASVSGAVGSVTGNVGGNVVGSVGSVTGNVGGNVTGSVGSVTGNVGGNVVGTIGGFTTAALAEFFTMDSGETYADAVAGSVVYEIATNAGGSGLTVQAIVDGVWDEPIASHLSAGSTGEALNAAGSAGDPWITTLPGSYTSGQAGYILGTYLDAAVTSRLAPTVASRTLDVTATGAAGIDWGNIDNATTSVNLSGTTISTSQTIASVSGTVGSVTGSVGSVTGNVGGDLTGSIGGFTQAALAQFFTTNTGQTYWDAVSGSVVFEIADNAISGDPWLTALPGTYGAGTAGYIVGTNLDATVSSRLPTASYVVPPTADQNATAVLTKADGVETGITLQGAQRVILAATAGKSDGFTGGAATVHYRDVADTKNVITATCTAYGSRTAVTLDTT